MNLTFPAVWALFPNRNPSSGAAVATALRAHVKALLTELAPHHTALAIVWTYEADDVSTAEDNFEHKLADHRQLPGELYGQRAEYLGVAAALDGLPVRQYDSYDDTLSYERGNAPPPLFGTDDSHMNPRGNEFLAGHIARFLTAAP